MPSVIIETLYRLHHVMKDKQHKLRIGSQFADIRGPIAPYITFRNNLLFYSVVISR